jgi:adenosine deaminase
VVLSTDDAGVSRINMTNEYFRAVHDQGLDYPTLKAIARNALTH